MSSSRNADCSCGSGLKYKHCCAEKQTPRNRMLIAGAIVLGLAVTYIVGSQLFGTPREPSVAIPGKVWSEEHGHWHDAGGTNPVGAPAGQAPPGKAWSAEHGHWHDAPAGAAGGVAGSAPIPAAPPGPAVVPGGMAKITPQPEALASPDGAAPPGKVWSEEHGHWHDAPAGAAASGTTQGGTPPPEGLKPLTTPQPDGPAPPGKVWSAEHGHWHDAP